MNEQVKKYIEKYPEEVIGMFIKIRQLIYDSAQAIPEETL